MAVMGVTKFERFFRSAAGLDVDRNDLERYSEFVERKIGDLLHVAEATAKANGRDIIERSDLPLTKGIQKSIHEYEGLDEEIELRPLLEHLAERRPAGLFLTDEAEARLPGVVGGVSVALARTFTIVEPGSRNPGTDDWERAFGLFDLLV